MAPPQSLPGLPDDFVSKLFHGDVVTKVADPNYRGKVVRGWTDEDAPPEVEHPAEQPLVRGEVMICHMQTGVFEVVPELSLQLFERSFLKGDLVKHALTDLESAVVVDVQTECVVEHVMSRERIVRPVPWTKLKNAVRIEAKDKVVYDEWIGTVEEVFEDGLIEAARDGSCYRIAEMGGLLETGRFAHEVLPDHPGVMAEFNNSFPPSANASTDRVISVRPLIVFVIWNAINQTLPIAEHEKHPEPQRFWCNGDIEKLTHFEGMKHQAPPLGTTVVFRDRMDEIEYGAKATHHVNGTYQLRVFRVVENRTKLKLRWQDGTETEEFSVGFVPYRNVDDYESWPGEHLVWRSDTGERRPAVVQSYNPRQRVANILLTDTKEKETVSVLELDTGGFGKANYGVGLGQHILFCDDNGAQTPEVPALGQVDPPEDGRDGFRNELHRLGLDQGMNADVFGGSLPKGDQSLVKWWGEVVDLHLDGQVEVELYTGERRTVNIKNVIILNEPEGAFPGEFEDDVESIHSDRSWETMSGDEDMASNWDNDGDATQDRFDDLMDVEDDGADSVEVADDDEEDARAGEAVEALVSEEEESVSPPETRVAEPTAAPSGIQDSSDEAGPSTLATRPTLAGDDKWTRFEILEGAPADHHYYSEPRLPASSKAYHSRIMKEHRALASSLPDNILVRTYEDRTDLMRVLIIGPEGTPYTDAPFVFDLYLNPTKFPFEPPLVYFHSHTNGLGRCNPNLYEEGKVCLSILGTWAGDKSESWNPTKSSLLQVFVSISGLVLVRSPYHCEPAFAKLEGTREGRVNSRLYSEKAYVLSRSFVRTALERPPTGLADELRHLYLEKGRLASIINHARLLIDKGEAEAANGNVAEDEENEEMWNADAMGSLTMGAILTLKRTIAALQRIAEREGVDVGA
ncbi:putative ubiquitin-conjugating enzyme E2 23 [Vanrija pseudolonga]|uniref:Ubiquitin-conjugating enzyme E2 23 n=1 Tax=Vanrija pseudolonga TaxID=143232 RepID=A0AAF1BNW1_9TREE|nr:putative ubiquitin-conjugating enzyme E2 23 [Vanrija pseudolonga]